MKDYIWCEAYRPKVVADTILPEHLKKTFQTFVDQKEIPNLLLHGRAGIGKTTVAKAMLNEIGADFMVINGSMNGNIDTLRNEIQTFASSVSFTGGRKYVILDEADYLNANSTQPALRNFMEEFSKNCGFILTANYVNRIIEPLHSRCSVIHFKIENADKQKIAADFFKRVLTILEKENVTYDKASVAKLIETHFPDWRRVLNELQRYAVTGRIDAGIFANADMDKINQLIDFMKAKKFSDARKWIGHNSDLEASEFYRKLYEVLPTKVKSTSSVMSIIVTLADAQYKEAFVADTEINRAATIATLMSEITDWS